MCSGFRSKCGYVCFVIVMSWFSVVTIVVLFRPRYFSASVCSKKNFIAFRAGVSLSILSVCPNSFHRCFAISADIGCVLVVLYK